jgi:hypothetical protein
MTTTATVAETRTSLYRFFDEEHGLLYVGITNDPWRRWREHVLTQPWYPQAKHWTVTWHDTEPAARRAELKAIRGERPRFNIADLPAPVQPGFTVREQTVATACSVWLSLGWCLAVSVATWHVHWVLVVSLPFLFTSPAVVAIFGLVFFTGQVRRVLAWIDQHVVYAPRSPGFTARQSFGRKRGVVQGPAGGNRT